MIAASQPQRVTLRSGDVVPIRQVRPNDAQALVRAYANLGEQSRYRRFFTVMPELPEGAGSYRAVAGEHRAQGPAARSPASLQPVTGGCSIDEPSQWLARSATRSR